ncbi:MAG: hypothetical protein K9K30_08365 [Burkholderiaceae bacterium]|jgi:signal transduction histidine kinase|nr:hypothetical protein [Sulfuritalea sp.]MCF8175237.1 hypothetical protein [Burkholderiaceae bacterium]MCF8183345.1 hypothetical protein [Polynucleobacter sp.]
MFSPKAPPAVARAKVGAGKTAPETPAAAPMSAETGIDNFLLLMRRELAEPLGKLAELARRIESLRVAGYVPTTLAGEQAFAELAEVSRRGADTASRLIALGELLAGPPILADEHIMLAEHLHRAAAGLVETAQTRGVGLRLDDSKQNLAAVYGSRHWLGLALRALLGLLIEAAPVGAHLLLRVRQIGFHQLVTADINHNQPAPATLDLLRSAHAGVKGELAAASRVGDLDLGLARAVVELHGGTLKTDITEQGVLHQFTLTLPTGQPQALGQRPDCANCPSMHQAEQFAQDIGELLNAMQTQQQQNSTRSRK